VSDLIGGDRHGGGTDVLQIGLALEHYSAVLKPEINAEVVMKNKEGAVVTFSKRDEHRKKFPMEAKVNVRTRYAVQRSSARSGPPEACGSPFVLAGDARGSDHQRAADGTAATQELPTLRHNELTTKIPNGSLGRLATSREKNTITADVVDSTAVVTNVFTGVIGSSPLACSEVTMQKGRAVAVSPTAFLALADSAETMLKGRAVAVSPTAFLALAGSAETMQLLSVGCTRTGWPLRRRRQPTAVGLQKPNNENDEPYDYPEYTMGPLESGREWCMWESLDVQGISHSITITEGVQPKEYALESPLTPSDIVNDAAKGVVWRF
jgi:hypothetical protein